MLKKEVSFYFFLTLNAIAMKNSIFYFLIVSGLFILGFSFEAKTDISVGGEYHICYSESRVKVGYTYYDCGSCPTKVYDEKGRGNVSKCFDLTPIE